VNKTINEAMDNSIYPFDYLKYKLRKIADIPDDRVVSIVINYLPPHQSKEDILPSLARGELRAIDTLHTRYDLEMMVTDGPELLSIKTIYRHHLYSERRIKKILKGIRDIIARIVADAHINLSEFDLSPGFVKPYPTG
jgi:hypothetical protein